jgi:hypothetical protein
LEVSFGRVKRAPGISGRTPGGDGVYVTDLEGGKRHGKISSRDSGSRRQREKPEEEKKNKIKRKEEA